MDVGLVGKIIRFSFSHTFSQIINMFRYKLHKPLVVLPYRPIKLSLYITRRCNLKCKMCIFTEEESSNDYFYEDMPFVVFKKIISKFREAAFLTLTAEGEPFLNKEIFEMIKYASKVCRMRVQTSTNGELIESAIEDIVSSKLAEINVSVDGITAEKFKSIRGGDTKVFEKIINNISKLVGTRNKCGSKLIIRISHLITQYNYKEIPAIIDFAESLGVDSLFFHNLVAFDTEMSKADSCLCDDTEVNKFITSVRLGKKRKLQIHFPVLYSNSKDWKICNNPFSAIGINSKGDINLCCNLKTQSFYGNIFREQDVWNNGQFQQIRKKFISQKLPFSICSFCPAIYKSGDI